MSELSLGALFDAFLTLKLEREASGLQDTIEIHFEQFRFPRSRKRRVRQKWSSDPRNWRQVKLKFF